VRSHTVSREDITWDDSGTKPAGSFRTLVPGWYRPGEVVTILYPVRHGFRPDGRTTVARSDLDAGVVYLDPWPVADLPPRY